MRTFQESNDPGISYHRNGMYFRYMNSGIDFHSDNSWIDNDIIIPRLLVSGSLFLSCKLYFYLCIVTYMTVYLLSLLLRNSLQSEKDFYTKARS